MRSSKNPPRTDERTTTEIGIVNYESHLSWELSTGCSVTASDTLVFIIQKYIDFSSILCITG
jgi:hypothetical protein